MSEKKKKKKLSIKMLVLFIFYEIFFIGVTLPFAVLYGPFDKVKKVVICTVQSTQHRYMLNWFLSKDYINKYTSVPVSASPVTQTMSKIKITNTSKDVEVSEIHDNNGRFDGYLMVIPPQHKIKAAMTKYLNIKGEKTSQLAKDHNAAAAINGGTFYDNTGGKYAGSGATPGGFVISNGETIYKDCSMDDRCNTTALTADGKLVVGSHSINELKNMKVMEAVTFDDDYLNGNALIVDGEGQIKDQEQGGYSPRTAVGQKSDGTVLFLVVDGRKGFSKMGASYYDMQKILLDYGAVNASALDGGDSATMYYNGKIINNPNIWSGERSVATAFVVEP